MHTAVDNVALFPSGAGALAAMGGNVAIDMSTFQHNQAEAGGGAIAINATDAPADDAHLLAVNITRTRFVSNRALHGGGLLIMSAGRTSPHQISNTSFESCTAATVGGGLNVLGSGSFVLLDTAFVGCTANGVGAAVNYEPTEDVLSPLFRGTRFSLNVGLSTLSAAGIISWSCRSGSFGPPLGAVEGDWEGCPYLCRP
jgi:predicted outer membrane repeat protein